MFLKRALLFLLLVSVVLNPHLVQANQGEEDVYNKLEKGELILKDRKYQKDEKPTVYLTFDDGPSYLTRKILDILKKEDIEATFFVIGQSIKGNEDIMKRMVNEGHSIGNHTYSHQYNKIYTSFSEYWGEVQKTEDLIYETIGERPSLVRAPGGTYKNWDSFYFYYMDQANYIIHDWNVDSGDSKRAGVPTTNIIHTVKKSILKSKLIVLMHDGYGHKNTVEALPAIIEYYRELGYQFKPLTVNTEPIIQPLSKPFWTRKDDYELRYQFVRTKIIDVDKVLAVKNIRQENIDYTRITDVRINRDRKDLNGGLYYANLEQNKKTKTLSTEKKLIKGTIFKHIGDVLGIILYNTTKTFFTFPSLFIYNEF